MINVHLIPSAKYWAVILCIATALVACSGESTGEPIVEGFENEPKQMTAWLYVALETVKA